MEFLKTLFGQNSVPTTPAEVGKAVVFGVTLIKQSIEDALEIQEYGQDENGCEE